MLKVSRKEGLLMDNYYEAKKKNGFIFTRNNTKNDGDYTPTTSTEGISWWSRKLGRYRTSEEQTKFVQKMISIGKMN